jgi:hypothetical protein
MRPRVETVFQIMAGDLIQRVIPEIGSTYHQGTIGMVAALFGIVSEEWDRAASRRIEENDRMRELFRQSVVAVNDASLRKRILELADTRDHDFHIAALENNNCALRAALIELHAHVETQTSAEARKIDDAIWDELAKSTERRRLMSAQF